MPDYLDVVKLITKNKWSDSVISVRTKYRESLNPGKKQKKAAPAIKKADVKKVPIKAKTENKLKKTPPPKQALKPKSKKTKIIEPNKKGQSPIEEKDLLQVTPVKKVGIKIPDPAKKKAPDTTVQTKKAKEPLPKKKVETIKQVKPTTPKKPVDKWKKVGSKKMIVRARKPDSIIVKAKVKPKERDLSKQRNKPKISNKQTTESSERQKKARPD